MEIRFTVWQFVRLMVHLEDNMVGQPAQAVLLKAWNAIWQPLDQQLAKLAQDDFDAYSALMMDQDVIIDDATAEQAQTAQMAIEQIMAVMDKAIATDDDLEQLQNLKFERRELRQLARKLGRLN